MTILIIILVLLVLILGVALYHQIKAANNHTEEQQQLLKDYQKRVDEQERLLSDYRSLEQNFDNVGQGYEQALLAFDKIEEDKQKMQNTVNTLQQQNHDLQEQYQKLCGSQLQKMQLIEQAAFEAKKVLTTNPASALRQLNCILNANDVAIETAIEADDNITVGDIINKAVLESGIGAASYLTFTTEVGEDVKSTMLLTNEAQAVRALGALLDNAGKFTTEGSVKLTVKPQGTQLQFIVEDTGSGISAEDAEKIFEPFTKLNSYFEGAGVGLTAARSIARRLNGDLILDTTFEGPGARFVLSLPS
ncbi:MAG: sensor histidine kinase [Prevotella sp.]|nr:sensor histidine kinase [Prevotella sp.]